MQQLEERNTYTPTDIPQVSGNCGLALNREETLSVPDLKTSSNNSDAALTAILIRRTELASFCHSYQSATESGIRLPIRYSATNYPVRRGTLLQTLKSVVSATPAPHGGLSDTVLGIDRGIVNIAVTSNNKFFNSKPIKNVRAKYAYLRSKLQSKGTKSAKKLLRNISRKEERFVSDVNHCISKEIAAMPFDMFAIEDLNSIRVQSRTRGVEFTRKLNNWSFYQLEQFLRYKAEAACKSVVTIDPRYTSQKCSNCGHIYKGNRKGHSFKCVKCGFQIHADLNAARNIANLGKSEVSRLTVTQPYIAYDEAEARKGIDAEHSDNAPHFKSAE